MSFKKDGINYIKVAPFEADRRETKKLLDALIVANMPVPVEKQAANELVWYDTIKRRSLAKDSKVECV